MLQAMKATRMSYLNTDRENCILNTLSTQLHCRHCPLRILWKLVHNEESWTEEHALDCIMFRPEKAPKQYMSSFPGTLCSLILNE